MADETDNSCNGEVVATEQMGLRIASIFIILVASLFGAVLPVFLARQRMLRIPKLAFFICQYVGTGVIIATAWLHLLVPGVENLGDPCLEPRLGEYPWAFAIALWTVLLMFTVEMLATRATQGSVDVKRSARASDINMSLDPSLNGASRLHPAMGTNGTASADVRDALVCATNNSPKLAGQAADDADYSSSEATDAHRCQTHMHPDDKDKGGQDMGDDRSQEAKSLARQLLAIFILEFGVVFHSIFIGLTLATADDVIVLLVVFIFHQMFEGLGLGSRLATAPWPKSKPWLPYLLGAAFAISTPVGIAAGIGTRPENTNTQKLVNGIFDSISAGILMYTGLVELLAHEFMFNPQMQRAPLWKLLLAFACVAFGSAVMAVLAIWA